MEKLRDHRSERAARHDDRTFSAERSARTDRDGARKRLQNRHLRFHFAAVDQDRFDRLRNAVAANPLRAVARHQSDDQRADHGHHDVPAAQWWFAGDTSAVLHRW